MAFIGFMNNLENKHRGGKKRDQKRNTKANTIFGLYKDRIRNNKSRLFISDRVED